MANTFTKQHTTNLEKKFFIRKNELKTYQNLALREPEPVHPLLKKNAPWAIWQNKAINFYFFDFKFEL